MRATTLLTLLGGVWALSPQTVPVRVLSTPDVELAKPFSGVSAMRELSDGRLFVVDEAEKLVVLADLGRGTVTQIGREGGGPGEYRSPTRLLPAPGDTTIVGDLAGRLSKFAPEGRYAGDLKLPSPGDANSRIMGSIGRLASDAQGRIYRQASDFGAGRNGKPDSVAILRTDPRTGKTDTAAWLPVPPKVTEATKNGGGVSAGGRKEGPFVARATWVVAPDGRVAIISPEPYLVHWFSNGRRSVTGAPIAFQRVPVTGAEKQAYRENYASEPNRAFAVSINRSGGTGVESEAVPYEEPKYWPALKDPFANTPHTVLASPAGEVWVRKQLPYTEAQTLYDVIGADGTLKGQVRTPARTRVIGFGKNGAVYVLRMDDDDLQHLQRYRLASGPGN